MTVRKLQSTDGFVVYDYPDVPSSGIVRRGRKILQRSATDLARSATYAFAFFGVERAGVSAGINAEGDDQAPALAAALAELDDSIAAGQLELLPGKGVSAQELENRATATDSDTSHRRDRRQTAMTSTTLAATAWALGGSLEGRRLAVEGYDPDDPLHRNLVGTASSMGATVVEGDGLDSKPWMIWSADVDALLVGSKPGAMNHQGAESVNAGAIVPWGPLPITTKALAVLARREICYVPDFVSASAPLVIDHLNGSDAGSEQAVRRLVDLLTTGLDEAGAKADDTGDPLFVACCHRAEDFLAQWREGLPFGRPLAG